MVAGATVVLASGEEVGDPAALARLAARAQATVMQATPSLWQALMAQHADAARRMRGLVGGEALSPQLATDLVGAASEGVDLYGPTDPTVWSAAARFRGCGTVALRGCSVTT